MRHDPDVELGRSLRRTESLYHVSVGPDGVSRRTEGGRRSSRQTYRPTGGAVLVVTRREP